MLKKRSTALIILVLVVIAGTLFGTHRSLSQARSQVAAIYLSGTENDGYGIDNKLDQRRDKANDLCKIAAKYDAEAEIAAVKEAISAINEAENASEACAADLALTEACDALDAKLQSLSLSEEDEGYRVSLMADLSSYSLQLQRLAADYNSAAADFNDNTLGIFPANLLGPLTGVREVEAFS